jgi:hypothetical protein
LRVISVLYLSGGGKTVERGEFHAGIEFEYESRKVSATEQLGGPQIRLLIRKRLIVIRYITVAAGFL